MKFRHARKLAALLGVLFYAACTGGPKSGDKPIHAGPVSAVRAVPLVLLTVTPEPMVTLIPTPTPNTGGNYWVGYYE